MKKLLTVGPGTAAHRSTYPGKRALIITNSHAVLAAPGETEEKATGVFDSAMTHPYYTLRLV